MIGYTYYDIYILEIETELYTKLEKYGMDVEYIPEDQPQYGMDFKYIPEHQPHYTENYNIIKKYDMNYVIIQNIDNIKNDYGKLPKNIIFYRNIKDCHDMLIFRIFFSNRFNFKIYEWMKEQKYNDKEKNENKNGYYDYGRGYFNDHYDYNKIFNIEKDYIINNYPYNGNVCIYYNHGYKFIEYYVANYRINGLLYVYGKDEYTNMFQKMEFVDDTLYKSTTYKYDFLRTVTTEYYTDDKCDHTKTVIIQL